MIRVSLSLFVLISACVPGPDLSEIATCSATEPCEAGRVCEQGVCLIPSGVLVETGQQDNGRCGDGLVRRYVLAADGAIESLEASDERYEVCDDGNAVDGDGCDGNCTLSACGNGVVAPNEECDDSNDSQTDACLNDCREATCGDGFVREGIEACDAGADNSDSVADACRRDCRQARCGDDVIDSGETCDEGLNDNADNSSCRSDCQVNECGDGHLRMDLELGQGAYEACDDGNAENGDGCVEGCRIATCGDGHLRTDLEPEEDGYEGCDDGDDVDGNDCTNSCTVAMCGDGVVHDQGHGLEECDDHNEVDTDACPNSCYAAVCGDGITRLDKEAGEDGFEACDDANEADDDACLSHCLLAVCGDGVQRMDLAQGEDGYEACDTERNCNNDCENTCGNGDYDGEFGEQCDDGNDEQADSCLNDCVLARCGDGILRQDQQVGQPGYEACEPDLEEDAPECSARCELVPPGVSLGEEGGMGQLFGTLELDAVGGSFTLTNDRVWLLVGRVFVPSGGVLRIEPGTEVRGGIDQEVGPAVLIVHPGGRLIADGSLEDPVVFTSANTFKQAGDWGGIILTGNGNVSCVLPGQGVCPDTLPALEANGVDLPFGTGSDRGNQVGTLRYVRIEYGGACAAFAGEDCSHRYHPLTLAGAGTRTVLDRIHVHRSAADGVRVFGGGMNLRRILVTQAKANGIAWSHGWRGHAQFVIVQHLYDALNPGAGFAGDGNEHNHNAWPGSYPSIANVTVINGRESVRLATGSRVELFNGIFANWAGDDCFRAYDGTFWNGQQVRNVVRNNYFNCTNACWENVNGSCDAIATADQGGVGNNRTLDPQVQGQRVSLVRPESRIPDFRPADFDWGPPAGINDGGFLEPVTYLGALAPEAELDWTAGWTRYDRQDGLVAHLDMEADENNEVELRELTGRYPADLSGAAEVVAGVLGNARSFTNGRYGEFPAEMPSRGDGARSAQFWLKVSAVPNTPKAELFAFGSPAEQGQYFAGLMCQSGQLAFNGGINDSDSVNCTGDSVADGEWHLVTFTYRLLNGNPRLAIYVDGAVVFDDTISGLREAGNSPGRVGAGRNNINQGFTLHMDEFRYYDRALDPAEVAHVFALEQPEP